MSLATAVTIRPATALDRHAIARLAALDSAAPPCEPVLVAEAAGEILAARSVSTGRAVADPFAPTAGLVELLRHWSRAAGC